MADQHNPSIPAIANTIAADIPDIKENLEFHKDCFEAITSGWSNTTAASLALSCDTLTEKTSDAGVTVDGVLIKDDGIKPTGTQLNVDIGGANQIAIKDGLIEPTTDNDIDLGSSSKQFKQGYFEGGITVNAVAQGKDVTAAIHRKIVNIGDWNMDSTNAISVVHGLTLSKIRVCSAVIISDNSATFYPVSGYNNQANFEINLGVDGTNVIISRQDSGTFDATGFDSTSFNRGYIVIDYVD